MIAALLALIAIYIWLLLALAPEPEALSARRAVCMPFILTLIVPPVLLLQFVAAALIFLANAVAGTELELPL